MEEDPHLTFFSWEIKVRTTAASLCKAMTPRGLLSLVLTDAQWNAYSAKRSVDQAGNLVIAPRFIPPVHIDVDDTMNSVVLFVTKSNNDQRL